MKEEKIKFPKRKFSVRVRLYDTVKQLQIATKTKKAAGLYHPEPYTIYPKTKIKPLLGTIHLARPRLGVGYITHEVLHCIFDYSEKMGMDLIKLGDNHDWEEELCWYQGYISKEICNWLNAKNLWQAK